jgi:hypothetical protein
MPLTQEGQGLGLLQRHPSALSRGSILVRVWYAARGAPEGEMVLTAINQESLASGRARSQ